MTVHGAPSKDRSTRAPEYPVTPLFTVLDHGYLMYHTGRLYPTTNFTGFKPWVRKTPGEGNGYPLQYSSLGNPMEKGAWQVIVQGVTKTHT